MSLWFKKPVLDILQKQGTGTMVRHLGIQITEAGDDYLCATMPVDERTVQPFGLLHGGASVVLAETIGSVAANMTVDTAQQYCVGLEINANHLRSAREGVVTGTGRPLHIGRTTQVWQIDIKDNKDRLICVSRITLAVLDRRD